MFSFCSCLNFSVFIIVISYIIIRFKNGKKKNNQTLLQFAQYNLLLVLIVLIIIWNQIYIISLLPVKGWDEKFPKTVYPLAGANVQIVPPEEKGYIIDSMSDATIVDGNMFSNTFFKTIKISKGETVQASLYCYVSEDFNGDSVKILIQGPIKGNNESIYQIFESKNDNQNSTQNLIYNGNFELGMDNWTAYAGSTTLTIIETPFGKGIRVTRGKGNGSDWSLRYIGRPIIYYAGHTYQIKFNFKVQSGIGIPFNIGWWVDIPNYAFALPLNIRKLKNGWNEAICSYKFKETSYDLVTFLNSLRENSIVDISNVEMTDLNGNDTILHFVDQLRKKGIWQHLKINVPSDRGKVSLFLRISKNGVTDFNSLKGYVIFARPDFRIKK
jgi:hypothetical protein